MGYAWLLGAVTVAMVLLAALADPLSAPDVACSRTAEVTIGTLAALLMVVLLAPAGADAVAAPRRGGRTCWGANGRRCSTRCAPGSG